MATIYSLEERVKDLEREIEQWKTWGIVEIAVRNPNVESYMGHWEKRARDAEEEANRLRHQLTLKTSDWITAKKDAEALQTTNNDFYKQMIVPALVKWEAENKNGRQPEPVK